MKQRLPWIFDGEDFSKYINRFGYSVFYEKREGMNGGMMLDGSMTVDVLAWKAVLQLPVNGLPADKMAQLVAACTKPYISVDYFDLRTGGQRSGVSFIPTLSEGVLSLINGEGTQWYRGAVLTLQEK